MLLSLMANSKYEYVKSFEEEDEVMLPNLIVVRIEGRNFRRYRIKSIISLTDIELNKAVFISFMDQDLRVIVYKI